MRSTMIPLVALSSLACADSPAELAYRAMGTIYVPLSAKKCVVSFERSLT